MRVHLPIVKRIFILGLLTDPLAVNEGIWGFRPTSDRGGGGNLRSRRLLIRNPSVGTDIRHFLLYR
jgi:hypothetical protein